MMTSAAYCPRCMKLTDLTIDDRPETLSVRGEDIEVEACVAVCSTCGEDVWLDEFEDATLRRAYSEYRRRHDLLQPADIQRIRRQWGLGQRAFSRLLGWGEITLHRYESGSLQDSAHDTQLRLAERPENVRVLLAAHGERLTPRQKGAVDRRLHAVETAAQKRVSKADDDQADYAVVGAGGGRGPGGVVSVRLEPDEMELLAALAEASGKTLSETLRMGLHGLSKQPQLGRGAGARARLDGQHHAGDRHP